MGPIPVALSGDEGPVADAAVFEQQLRDLAVVSGDALEILTRLAEAVFPGGAAMGDAARLLWPERSRVPAGNGRHGVQAEALEAQIRQSEARFRSLVEQLPAVVFYAALGDEESEVYVSPQIESLLGFTQKEWLTNPLLWYSQLHPDDHQTIIDAFTKGMQTGTPFRAEVRFFSRDGEEVWILGEARLIRDEMERPAYFQGVAFDVTITKRAQEMIASVERARAESAQLRAEAFATHNMRLRQLNRELRAAKEAAEAAAQARSTFLATMSHELRTPLNSIVVLSSLLADESLTPAQQDMVRRLQLSSDHLLELINDVLEFSRLRAGQVELEGRAFDVDAWIADTLEIVAPRAAEKALELRLTIATSLPSTLVADQGRLRQVLLNLLGNAVKFTAAGFVEVKLGGQQLDDGRWELECSVRDTGIGIRPEDAATLFAEFRQADSGISREFGGTGLGLAISRHLCELLGGRIWVDATDGPGTTVAFTWVAEAVGAGRIEARSRRSGGAGQGTAPPGAPAALLPHREPGRPTLGGGRVPVKRDPVAGPLRILIAEDNEMNQQVAVLLLAALGYQVDLVSNGQEAVTAVREGAYDVVLMDIAMPVTDGLSATRSIRALGREVHQPHIVALTAHAFPGDAEACIEAGMDDYLTKPIERARLAEALHGAAKRRAADAVPAGRGLVAAGAHTAGGDEFDPSLAREILGEFGQAALVELVRIFRAEATRLLDLAVAALASGDGPGAGMAAHTLKSGAANLGAQGLYETCARLENLARSDSLNGAGELTVTMGRQLDEALRLLDLMVGSSPPS